jgi:hypothetical protein
MNSDRVSKMGEHNFRKFAAASAIFASIVSCASAPPGPLVSSLSVSAPSAKLEIATSEQLAVRVSGAGGHGVFWKVIEGERGGTVSSSGLYVAPPRAGVFHVIAISVVDLSKSSTTAIEVVQPKTLIDSTALQPHAALTSNWARPSRL